MSAIAVPVKHSLQDGQLGALASLLDLLELSTHFRNDATLLGSDPVIRSPHKLGEASATAQLLIGAAGAAIRTARTREKTDIEIDIVDALHFLHSTHFVSQSGHFINVGAEFVELNGVFRCKDGGYVMIEAGPPYPKLLKGYRSKIFGCWTSPMCWRGPGAHVRSLNMELRCCTSARRLIPTHSRNTWESISANDAPIWTFGPLGRTPQCTTSRRRRMCLRPPTARQ
jgi:hypothetical protein